MSGSLEHFCCFGTATAASQLGPTFHSKVYPAAHSWKHSVIAFASLQTSATLKRLATHCRNCHASNMLTLPKSLNKKGVIPKFACGSLISSKLSLVHPGGPAIVFVIRLASHLPLPAPTKGNLGSHGIFWLIASHGDWFEESSNHLASPWKKSGNYHLYKIQKTQEILLKMRKSPVRVFASLGWKWWKIDCFVQTNSGPRVFFRSILWDLGSSAWIRSRHPCGSWWLWRTFGFVTHCPWCKPHASTVPRRWRNQTKEVWALRPKKKS